MLDIPRSASTMSAPAKPCLRENAVQTGKVGMVQMVGIADRLQPLARLRQIVAIDIQADQ